MHSQYARMVTFFFGKGSPSQDVPTLVHELSIYESCYPLQGYDIPVCLGLLELNRDCYLESPNPMTYFLLLSFGSLPLRYKSELVPPAEVVIASTERALKKLHGFHVTHVNICVKNVLWNTELQRAMIIDFGTSILREIPDEILLSLHHTSESTQKGRSEKDSDKHEFKRFCCGTKDPEIETTVREVKVLVSPETG